MWGQAPYLALYLLAFSVPAAVVWVAVAIGMSVLAGIWWVLALMTLAYSLFYGVIAIRGDAFMPPQFRWQVPARWIASSGLARRIVIWGSMLGPGFMTRNPYAGFWVLLLPLAAGQSLTVAACLGATHGAARGLGILSNVWRDRFMSNQSSWFEMPTWQRRDAHLLILLSGYLIGMLGAMLL